MLLTSEVQLVSLLRCLMDIESVSQAGFSFRTAGRSHLGQFSSSAPDDGKQIRGICLSSFLWFTRPRSDCMKSERVSLRGVSDSRGERG